MRICLRNVVPLGLLTLLIGLAHTHKNDAGLERRIRVILDTDANNELDDQHAMAYLFFNSSFFSIQGVTVNATYGGGGIEKHYDEAKRVMRMTNTIGKVPLRRGAHLGFSQIRPYVKRPSFDGKDAVDFIIQEARKPSDDKLVLLAVGKLTNVALAVEKDPSIINKIRLVWLGSNYPQPGEYNQNNDPAALSYLLDKNIEFEIVTVRYHKTTGSAAVTATKTDIERRMPGAGPALQSPVEGRHGGTFSNFGEYSVSLFNHIHYEDQTETRALFDVVAVAILKNPRWGKATVIPAPILNDNKWEDRPANNRTVTIWEDFDKDAILQDFFHVMRHYRLPD